MAQPARPALEWRISLSRPASGRSSTGVDAKRSQEIIDGLRNVPVLTVSVQHRFAQTGGIAGMYVQDGKMRFAINVEAAQRARVHLSSRLLSLATLVKDDHAHP